MKYFEDYQIYYFGPDNSESVISECAPDYDFRKPSKRLESAVEKQYNFYCEVCEKLNLEKPIILFFKSDSMGVFLSGTECLNPTLCLNTSLKDDQITDTVLHELAHAYLFSCGVYCEQEDAAEDFCWDQDYEKLKNFALTYAGE